MNMRTFKQNVLLVMAVYSTVMALGFFLKFYDLTQDQKIYSAFKDMINLIIAIPAAWLAYCVQRRQAYLKDVRDLWSKMVVSFQDAVQYTYLMHPKQDDYGKVLKGLSYVMDELRGVFANVGEDDENIGLFPFESMKNIQKEISALGFGDNFKKGNCKTARDTILEYWKKLRNSFLYELERGVPVKVDSPFVD
jgi:hypothetical protein